MDLSQETCLLCLSVNKNMIKFYSDTGKDLNIISVLSTHFWFQLDEIKVFSQNICQKCWKTTKSFHEFYQSVEGVHRTFETVFVKIENDPDVAQEAEIEQSVQVPHISHENITESVKIENDQDDFEEDDELCEIPSTNSIETETRAFDTLSKKSQHKYLSIYEKFMEWKAGENIDKDCFSEAVLLEYFYYLQSKYKSSSLCGQYSMLRTTVQRNNNIDISYPEIFLLLKKSSIGYQKPKTKVFQPDEIRRFLTEADDIKYLDVKVIAIFGIYGATHGEALTQIKVDDVIEQGSVFVVKIFDTRSKIIRSFTLEKQYAAYVQKYKKLRPQNVPNHRFFLNYQRGKCTKSPAGKHKFLITPKIIAKFLNLEDAEKYTPLSFRKDFIRKKTNKISEDDEATTLSVLPEKSRERYIRSYDKFLEWKIDEDIDKDCCSKEVLLQYFNYLKTKYNATGTLLTEYSKLKSTILKNHNIDISDPELLASLKLNAVRFKTPRSYTFEPDDMKRFLNEAEDSEFLCVKVIMIFGIYGVTKDALRSLTITDVNEQGSVYVVKITETRINAIRTFTLENEYAACVKKYKELRPESVMHKLFLINYLNGKCTLEPLNKTKMLSAPKAVARFLKLRDAENYTCLSFRRRSTKRLGMCSSTILDSYIDELIPNKKKLQEDSQEEIPDDTSREATVTDDTSPFNLIDTSALESLSEKSRERYKNSYEQFFTWKTKENIDKDCFSEKVILEYFNHLKTKFKVSTLKTEYSKLRTSIQKNDNIDINYPNMRSFLKNISIGFEPHKFTVFRPDEIQRFLSEAEDIKYLAAKVIVIFELHCTTSPYDLVKVDVKDVTEQGSLTVVKAIERKTRAVRSFTLENEYSTYVQRYKNLRSADTPHTRFFVNYQHGKCTTQPIGVQKIFDTAKVVANFLNFNAENYTCLSFSGVPQTRKSRKTKKLLADGGLSSTSIGDGSVNGSKHFTRSTKAMATSTITSSIDTSTTPIATIPLQTYHVQPYQVPPLQPMEYGQQQEMAASTAVIRTIPTTFQSSYAQLHQVQPYTLLPYNTSTVNTRPNDSYVSSNNYM